MRLEIYRYQSRHVCVGSDCHPAALWRWRILSDAGITIIRSKSFTTKAAAANNARSVRATLA